VFDAFGFPPVTEEEVRLATTCVDSRDLPDRDRAADVTAADRMLAEGTNALDIARVLDERGYADAAAAIFEMQRQRVAADYLQTSAIVAPGGDVIASINDPNRYEGPGTGYRLEGERWERLQRLPHVVDARLLGTASDGEVAMFETLGEASPGTRADEVVVAVGPAFGGALSETINGLAHRDVVADLVAGIEEAGAVARLVRIRRSSDVAFIGHEGARLSGSGVAVGVQSKGTALIHRADLEPLDNLELFGMAPSLTLPSYRQIGRNAAAYALGRPVAPVPTVLDNFARAKLIVRTTLMHARETAEVVSGGTPLALRLGAEARDPERRAVHENVDVLAGGT
jgi:dehydratase large subunit/dehydratase medium subunit